MDDDNDDPAKFLFCFLSFGIWLTRKWRLMYCNIELSGIGHGNSTQLLNIRRQIKHKIISY